MGTFESNPAGAHTSERQHQYQLLTDAEAALAVSLGDLENARKRYENLHEILDVEEQIELRTELEAIVTKAREVLALLQERPEENADDISTLNEKISFYEQELKVLATEIEAAETSLRNKGI
jgi:cell division FtsZ-interacting protein ZapD